MTQTCAWCIQKTDEPVSVGVAQAASGPGRVIHACCPACKRRYRIMPLDRYPPESPGEIRYEFYAAD
ncbi:hypothetical protein [Streptomyces sp. ODS05-4]|uniref:hypothetical protein n=1 Tax=Streptomyces sp. ODS05-4 TaxID=2944939 RepID=UPI0021094841|nr:hypothetical protein [Streptomyces sp. ODS05-4]